MYGSSAEEEKMIKGTIQITAKELDQRYFSLSNTEDPKDSGDILTCCDQNNPN